MNCFNSSNTTFLFVSFSNHCFEKKHFLFRLDCTKSFPLYIHLEKKKQKKFRVDLCFSFLFQRYKDGESSFQACPITGFFNPVDRNNHARLLSFQLVSIFTHLFAYLYNSLLLWANWTTFVLATCGSPAHIPVHVLHSTWKNNSVFLFLDCFHHLYGGSYCHTLYFFKATMCVCVCVCWQVVFNELPRHQTTTCAHSLTHTTCTRRIVCFDLLC